jgi:hypothetical protein
MGVEGRRGAGGSQMRVYTRGAGQLREREAAGVSPASSHFERDSGCSTPWVVADTVALEWC